MTGCATCNHPEIEKINALLRSKTSMAEVARRFDLSYESVRWHWHQGHCPPELETHFITPKKLDDLTESIDGAKEMERVVFEARNLFYNWRKFEQEQGQPTRQTINALNTWRRAARDYLDLVFDVKERPDIQVSVFMPFMLKIVEQFPVDLRQKFYKTMKIIDIDDFEVAEEHALEKKELTAQVESES